MRWVLRQDAPLPMSFGSSLRLAVLVLILLSFSVGFFVLRYYVKQLLHDLFHLSHQVAEADTVIGEHMQQVPALKRQLQDVSQRLIELTNQTAEFEQSLETISDRQDGLRYGLIEIRDYVRYHGIAAQQRRSMFTQE